VISASLRAWHAAALLAPGLLVGSAAGCRSGGWALHPDYARFEVATIVVEPTRNETIHRGLDRVRTSGLLQGIIAPTALDALATVRNEALGELERRGYDAVANGHAASARAVDAAPGAATLVLSLISWRFASAARDDTVGTVAVSLHAGAPPASATEVYSHRAAVRRTGAGAGARHWTTAELESALRLAVRRALAGLPERSAAAARAGAPPR
jgi:hypothetical protein